MGLSSGNFLWLSAQKPITAPGNPLQFPAGTTDLQSWIRNDGQGGIGPDWERIGTDVTGQCPFNATFSLLGTAAPEPSGMVLAGAGLCGLLLWRRRVARAALTVATVYHLEN